MKIAVLVTRMEKPSARYRILQYLPYLEKEGYEPHVFVLPGSLLKRRVLFNRLADFDVVFLQKKLLSGLDFRYLRKKARRLIYDYDDAVMFRDPRRSRQECGKRLRSFERTLKHVDWVIAGNAYLKGMAQGLTEKISVLPTPVPLESYQVKDYSIEQQSVTLGWIGSTATVHYLNLISGDLKSLAEEYPQLRLKVVSDSFPSLQGIPVEEKRWSGEEEAADLCTFDIGLMPLTNDPYSRGKCGFKILQYMAAGVPVVCSPVGMNREIVEDGVQGFWASSGEDWRQRLASLIEDPKKRATMGLAGRKRVSETYTLRVNAPKLAMLIRSLCL